MRKSAGCVLFLVAALGTIGWTSPPTPISAAPSGEPRQIGSADRLATDVSADGRYVLTRWLVGPEFERVDALTGDELELPQGWIDPHMADGGDLFVLTSLQGLLPTDTDGEADIYSYRASTGAYALLTPPVTGGDTAYLSGVSEDGDVVMLNLGNGATTRNTQAIWVRSSDQLIPFDTLLPVQPGSLGNQSTRSDTSYDGRYTAVVMYPFAGCTNCAQLYVYDRATDTLSDESTVPGGALLDSNVEDFAISANGRQVIFTSRATNVVPGSSTSQLRVYARDLDSDAISLLEANAGSLGVPRNSVSISGDGSTVTFLAPVPPSSPSSQPVLLDRESGQRIVLTDPPGPALPDGQGGPAIVASGGSAVAFSSVGGSYPPIAGPASSAYRVFYKGVPGALPARLADTRANGQTIDSRFVAGGLRAARSTMELTVAGRGAIPPAATTVTLNVTTVGATSGGFVTVSPCGTDRPTAASLNLAPGQAAANLVLSRVGAGGKVCIYTSASTHLIVDAAGSFTDSTTLSSITPQRMLDRRSDGVTVDGQFVGGGALAADTELALTVSGRTGVPAGSKAAILNLAVVAPTGNGFVKAYPCGSAVPNAATINYVAGQTRASQTIVALDASGRVCLQSSSPTTLVGDVSGFVAPTSKYVPLTPSRLLETRQGQTTVDGQFQGQGLRTAGSVLALTVKGRGGVDGAARSVMLNIAATGASVNGYATAFPCGQPVPTVASVNFRPNAAVNNHTIVSLGSNDQVCFFVSGAVHLIADVVGYLP
jgi:hypothetical protein